MPEIIPNWHPLLVHFTIGLLLAGTVFYLLALLLPSGRLSLEAVLAARWTLSAGMLITFATVLAGWYAYGSVAHDDAGHAAMTDHRNWALATAALFLVLVLWDLLRARDGRKAGLTVGLALLAASVLLGVTGYKGGEVVYRHGIGVMSLPDVDDHAHGDDAHGHEGTAGNTTPDGYAEKREEGHDADDDHHEGADQQVDGEAEAGGGAATAKSTPEPTSADADDHHDDGHDHTH